MQRERTTWKGIDICLSINIIDLLLFVTPIISSSFLSGRTWVRCTSVFDHVDRNRKQVPFIFYCDFFFFYESSHVVKVLVRLRQRNDWFCRITFEVKILKLSQSLSTSNKTEKNILSRILCASFCTWYVIKIAKVYLCTSIYFHSRPMFIFRCPMRVPSIPKIPFRKLKLSPNIIFRRAK